ncbi:MAG: LacI family DNA-binding transcriptional regulator [Chloroflexi bacterium]|nr:LacI family DNA-binding transcriptional regulator [Chloroflexota bacterium]
MAVTLKDIAKHTGYSITTISRALAGYSDVSPSTRQKVQHAAELLGYQPNLVARHLQSQRTRTIGMVLPLRDQDVTSDFFTELLRGVSDRASQANYDILTSAQMYGSDEEMYAYRRIVGGGRVDGMIVARARRNDPRIAYLKALDFPFAVSGSGGEDDPSDFPHIDVDNQDGIQQATDHLIDLGHRTIGLILPPEEMAYTAQRHHGYQRAASGRHCLRGALCALRRPAACGWVRRRHRSAELLPRNDCHRRLQRPDGDRLDAGHPGVRQACRRRYCRHRVRRHSSRAVCQPAAHNHPPADL